MNPRMPQEYEELRRQQILQAAWDLFAEKGYRDATVREIAARMGVTTGVVYTYYKSKDEIIEALGERSQERSDALFERLAGQMTVRRALETLFSQCAEDCRGEDPGKHARANLSLIIEGLRRPELKPKIAHLHQHALDNMAQLAAAGCRRGEIRAGIDPGAFAGFIMALFFGLQVQTVIRGDSSVAGDIENIGQILLRNVWQDPERRSQP